MHAVCDNDFPFVVRANVFNALAINGFCKWNDVLGINNNYIQSEYMNKYNVMYLIFIAHIKISLLIYCFFCFR